MATLNPSIILAGQQADIMGSFDRGQQAGERQNQIRDQNALRNLYQTQGAGLVAGEQGAINALAGINAPLAMDFRRTQQTLQIDQENARLRAAELAATLDQTTRTRAGEQFTMGANMIATAQTPEQFQAIVSRPGFVESAGILGITPDMLTFENRDTLAAAALGAADVMKLREGPKPEAPMTLIGKINADLAAGRISRAEAEMELQRAAPRGTSFEVGPDGQFRFTEGVGVGGAGAKFTEGQSKDNVYATRAEGALALLDSVGADVLADRAPRVGEALGGVTLGLSRQLTQSDDFQRAQQAGDEFLQAILRKDTGAAITEGEQSLYGQTYLPRPGDSPAVIEAKRQARIRAIEAIRSGMNPQQQAVVDQALINSAARSGQVPTQPQAGASMAQDSNPGDVRPRIGTVQDGYRYIGGNPANPSSWEQVQ